MLSKIDARVMHGTSKQRRCRCAMQGALHGAVMLALCIHFPLACVHVQEQRGY